MALAGCYHVQDVSRSKLWRHLDFPIPCSHCCSLCSYQHWRVYRELQGMKELSFFLVVLAYVAGGVVIHGGTAEPQREAGREMRKWPVPNLHGGTPLPKQYSTRQRICTRPLILLAAQIVIVLAKTWQPAASPCPKATVVAAKYLNTTFYFQLGTLNTHGIYNFFVQKRTARTDQTTWIDGSYNISTGRYQSSSGLLGRSRIYRNKCDATMDASDVVWCFYLKRRKIR